MKLTVPQESYDIYHNRDMIEKGFFKYKNVLKMNKLKVQSDKSFETNYVLFF
jgi:hypothetical protein